MSAHFREVFGTRSGDDDIDPGLLEKTQAYLECQSQGLRANWQFVEAWEQFYGTYGRLIRRFAVACHVPKAGLDDCVQQVWCELVRRLRHFRYDPQRACFRSWLYLLVQSKAIDLIRYRASHPTKPLPEAAAAALYDRDGDPAAAYQLQRKQAAVRRVLAELGKTVSARNYRVLHMRWIEGRTVPETAAALGLTPAQVSLLGHRIKRKFRRLFSLYTGYEWYLHG